MPGAKFPSKRNRAFFEFRYGSLAEPEFFRVVSDNRAWSLAGKTYEPMAVAHVLLPEQGVGLNEKDAEVELPLIAGGWTERVSAAGICFPIELTIREQMVLKNGGYADDIKTMFNGTVVRRVRYHNGRARVVGLFCRNDKSDLKEPLGFSCNHHCAWTLGGNGCFFNILNERATVTASDIDGVHITLDDGLGSGGIKQKPDGWWIDGFIEFGGMQITIKDWEGNGGPGGGSLFTLSDVAPEEFEGNDSVLLYPGCSGTKTDCDGKYNNIENFGGFGVGIPPFHPGYEVPL